MLVEPRSGAAPTPAYVLNARQAPRRNPSG